MADKGPKKPAKKSAGGAQELPDPVSHATTPTHAAEAAIDNAQDAVDALKAEASAVAMDLPDFGGDGPETGDPCRQQSKPQQRYSRRTHIAVLGSVTPDPPALINRLLSAE